MIKGQSPLITPCIIKIYKLSNRELLDTYQSLLENSNRDFKFIIMNETFLGFKLPRENKKVSNYKFDTFLFLFFFIIAKYSD